MTCISLMYSIHVQNIQWRMNEENFTANKWTVAMKFHVSFWKCFSLLLSFKYKMPFEEVTLFANASLIWWNLDFWELKNFQTCWKWITLIREHRAHTHKNPHTQTKLIGWKSLTKLLWRNFQLMKKIIFLTRNKIFVHFIYSLCPKVEAKHFQCNHEMKSILCVNIHWSYLTLKSPIYFYCFLT